jgi:hypothetical protein
MSDNTYTLLIWDMIPEEQSLYLIPNSDIDAGDRELLERAHRNYVNIICDDEDAAIQLSEWLADADFPNVGDTPITGHTITHVYASGFMM